MTTAWLASVLRPQDMIASPGTSDLAAHLEMAEIVRGLAWRRQMRDDSGGASQPAQDPSLLLAGNALDPSPSSEDVAALSNLVLQRDHEDLGRLAALALLTCVAAAARDDYATCRRILEHSITLLTPVGGADARLMRAALFQQLALRQRDFGLNHHESTRAVLEEIRLLDVSTCTPFETMTRRSNYTTTLEGIRLSLVDAALRFNGDDDDGNNRDHPLRDKDASRGAGQADHLLNLAVDSYAGVLGRNFVRAATGKLQAGGGAAQSIRPKDLLRNLELLGHQHVYAVRRSVAEADFVEHQAEGIGEVDQVLPLLRRAFARDDFSLALRWFRSNGPLEVILGDARRIIHHRTEVGSLRSLELQCLELAADLLAPLERAKGVEMIDAALDAGGPFDFPGAYDAPFRRLERAWVAMAALAGTPGLVAHVSDRLLRSAEALGADDDFLDQAVARGLSELDVDVLPEDNKTAWAAWVESHPLGGSHTRRIAQRYLQSSGPLRSTSPLLDAAERIDRIILGLAEPATVLDVDVETVVEAMRSTRQAAARGVSQFGGIEESDVAAALILRGGRVELWPELTEFLLDDQVDSTHKRRAMERVAKSRESLPATTLQRFAAASQALLYPSSDGPFGNTSLRPYPPAIRMLGAHECIPRGQVTAAISEWMQDREAETRREAAMTAAAALDLASDPWLSGLTIHMTYDDDARVRGAAAQGLVALIAEAERNSRREPLAVDRVISLLRAGGSTSVSAILSALSVEGRHIPRVLRGEIETLASNHISQTVRRAAREVLAKAG